MEDEVGVDEVSFGGFGRGRERREERVAERVEREIAVRSFWSHEGPGASASPVKKRRSGLDEQECSDHRMELAGRRARYGGTCSSS